jgi:hypothetical protein
VSAALLLIVAFIIPGLTRESRPIQWASDAQLEGFSHGPTPLCLSGGWGSGKTWEAVLKGIYLSTVYHKNRGVIARHVGAELRATTMATFYKVCPPDLYDPKRGGRRNDQNGYMKFRKPFESEVLFLHLDKPETEGIIRGLEINWAVIDQAEENPEHMEEIFDLLLGRLSRWDIAVVPQEELDWWRTVSGGKPWPFVHPEKGTPVPPPYFTLCVNPDVETHWVYRRFHEESEEFHTSQGVNEDGSPRPSYKDRGYKMIHMPSTSNRFLSKDNLRFLMAHDEAFIRRNVKGLWGQPEGAIHAVDNRSIIEGSYELADYLRRTCTLYRTFDYGDSAPTCCLWWAVDRNGNCFCWQEYYLAKPQISVHRSNISSLTDLNDRYEGDIADPSIFHTMPTKKGGRWSVASEYAEVVEQPRNTAIFWTAADNNELGTRNRINEYLLVDPERIHPFTREMGSPRLFFLKRNDRYPQGCVHSIKQIRAQRRVKIGTDLGKPVFSDERDPDITDHAYDPIRYFVASRPAAPPTKAIIAAGSFQAVQKLIRTIRKQGRVR